MASPQFAPVDVNVPERAYESPAHVPGPWVSDRPADIVGFQPEPDEVKKAWLAYQAAKSEQ